MASTAELKEAEMNIEKMCKNMGLYYKALNKEYPMIGDNEDLKGLFEAHCENNGYDYDGVVAELAVDSGDEVLCDPDEGFADGDFPFPEGQPQTAATITRILEECNKLEPCFAEWSDALPKCMF